MKKLIAFAAVLLMLSTANAYAFSCRGKFIKLGMRFSDVLNRCGEPADVQSWQDNEPVYPNSGYVGNYYYILPGPVANYEEWTYNLGPSYFIQILTFKNGKLVRIDQGDYGY